MRADNLLKDEVSLSEIYLFFAGQVRTIAVVFFILFTMGFGYAITRPTLYISVASVTIGESLNLDSSESEQLENPEIVVYKYSHVATIKPIRKTNIVEVSAIAEDREQSIQKVQLTINDIVTTQNDILQTQENKFIKYLDFLKITDTTKMQVLSILQDASNSSVTHSSEIATTELPYSGKIYKIVLGTILIAGLAALVIGAIKAVARPTRKLSNNHRAS
jgi:hypothetical protein